MLRSGRRMLATAPDRLPLRSCPLILQPFVRNLTDGKSIAAAFLSILALKLKPIIAEKAKENLKVGAEITNTGLQKSVKAVNTQKELAKVAGVSHDTIADKEEARR